MNARERAKQEAAMDAASELERLVRDNLTERLQFSENIGDLDGQGHMLNALRSLEQACEALKLQRGWTDRVIRVREIETAPASTVLGTNAVTDRITLRADMRCATPGCLHEYGSHGIRFSLEFDCGLCGCDGFSVFTGVPGSDRDPDVQWERS
jgi:hypothetical protein